MRWEGICSEALGKEAFIPERCQLGSRSPGLDGRLGQLLPYCNCDVGGIMKMWHHEDEAQTLPLGKHRKNVALESVLELWN